MYARKDRKADRVKVRRRIRGKVRGTAGRPRLSVFRSRRHISVQAIDDVAGTTLAAASTLEKSCKVEGGSSGSKVAAAAVGRLIAERLKEKGLETVVFDGGGFLFHGRVKALADAAREGGLKF